MEEAPSAELVEQHAAGLADGIAKGQGATASYSFPLPEGWFAETDPLPRRGIRASRSWVKRSCASSPAPGG
jgi:hypothetical protein